MRSHDPDEIWVESSTPVSYLAIEGRIKDSVAARRAFSDLAKHYDDCPLLTRVPTLTIDEEVGLYLGLGRGGVFALIHFLSEESDPRQKSGLELKHLFAGFVTSYLAALARIEEAAKPAKVVVYRCAVKRSAHSEG